MSNVTCLLFTVPVTKLWVFKMWNGLFLCLRGFKNNLRVIIDGRKSLIWHDAVTAYHHKAMFWCHGVVRVRRSLTLGRRLSCVHSCLTSLLGSEKSWRLAFGRQWPEESSGHSKSVTWRLLLLPRNLCYFSAWCSTGFKLRQLGL